MPNNIIMADTKGGGTSLPTSISKIDGGEWTQATTVSKGGLVDISHNLGEIPDFILIRSNYPDVIPTLNSSVEWFCFVNNDHLTYGVRKYITSDGTIGDFAIVNKVAPFTYVDGRISTGSNIFSLIGPDMFQVKSGSADHIESGLTFRWIAGCYV